MHYYMENLKEGDVVQNNALFKKHGLGIITSIERFSDESYWEVVYVDGYKDIYWEHSQNVPRCLEWVGFNKAELIPKVLAIRAKFIQDFKEIEALVEKGFDEMGKTE